MVPFNAGGGTDTYVRMLAEEMTKRGQRVIVENKPGGSGVIAAGYVAKAPPDGQTLLMSFVAILGTNTVLFDKLPYDPQKDFASVSQIAYQPTIIVGRTELPYRNIKEMVEYAKANPGKINRGSPGAAILSNLAPVAFEKSTRHQHESHPVQRRRSGDPGDAERLDRHLRHVDHERVAAHQEREVSRARGDGQPAPVAGAGCADVQGAWDTTSRLRCAITSR